MEGTRGPRLISPDDREWWTGLDEEYWQAVLAQGESPPESVPPLDPQEIFQVLDIETNSNTGLTAQGDAVNEPGQDWQVATRAMERGESFSLMVSGANRGGVLVDWNGLQGFVPASHLTELPRSRDPQQRLAELADCIGQSLTVRLIEVDVEQKRLVFSQRAALSEFHSPASLLNSLKPGDVRRGTVTNLTSFGAFIDLGGVEGLIHVSEMSWDRVRHPSDVLRSGWEVEVYVLGVNPEEGRIALSLKRLRPNPWTEVESRYQVGQIVEGEVTNVVSFGAFVRLEEGLEGLIHISELAEGNFLHPRNVVREGDAVRVRVLSIDGAKQRLGLSLRQAYGVGSDGSHLRDGR